MTQSNQPITQKKKCEHKKISKMWVSQSRGMSFKCCWWVHCSDCGETIGYE